MIALGHHPTTLIVGRALQGLSTAVVVHMTLAITKFAFLNEKESFAIALWTGAVGHTQLCIWSGNQRHFSYFI